MTARDLIRKLEKIEGFAPEVRIEFDGDDQTPQELVAIDKRIDEDGNEFFCLVVRNT